MGDFIRGTTTISLPPSTGPIIDFEVNIQGEWVMWSNKVSERERENIFTLLSYFRYPRLKLRLIKWVLRMS